MDVREERVQLAFPEDVITFRGNDAEINVNDAVTATFNNKDNSSSFLKKGGPRVLNASHYFDDLFRLAKHARAHPAIGLVKHSSSLSLSRCTRAHTPLAQPNLVITYRFRVVVSLSPRYRFPLCRSAADKAFLATCHRSGYSL